MKIIAVVFLGFDLTKQRNNWWNKVLLSTYLQYVTTLHIYVAICICIIHTSNIMHLSFGH